MRININMEYIQRINIYKEEKWGPIQKWDIYKKKHT